MTRITRMILVLGKSALSVPDTRFSRVSGSTLICIYIYVFIYMCIYRSSNTKYDHGVVAEIFEFHYIITSFQGFYNHLREMQALLSISHNYLQHLKTLKNYIIQMLFFKGKTKIYFVIKQTLL